MEYIELFVDFSTNFITTGGLLYGFFLVFIECFVPMLPLAVFVALNVNAFGYFIGLTISYLATSLGSVIVYYIFSFFERKFISKHLNRKTAKKLMNGVNKFKKITFPELVLLITLPFTPSSFINIISGLARVPKEKFIAAILIGKIFVVIFWGFIGKSFLDSLYDIKALAFIVLTLIIAYIISKIVSKKMNIE